MTEPAIIIHLTIERFRGIESLEWNPAPETRLPLPLISAKKVVTLPLKPDQLI